MRIILLLVLMLLGKTIFCQSGDIKNESEEKLLKDTTTTTLYKKTDSLAGSVQVIDTNSKTPPLNIDVNYMVAHQQENKARQKKSTILRIVIGVGLFVILIFRMRKKSKK